VVGVGEDVEDVAQQREQILLVELARNVGRRGGKVVDNLERD
jgi:hypothetical protein